MRRSDREVTDFNEIAEIMKACDVCRLAISNGDYPYILPLNFGMTAENGKIRLYFHSAAEGTKLELLKKHPQASFEMDRTFGLRANYEKKNCTMGYESVIGRGSVHMIAAAEEKLDALTKLNGHYHPDGFPVNEKVIANTAVYYLDVEEMTAKRRKI